MSGSVKSHSDELSVCIIYIYYVFNEFISVPDTRTTRTHKYMHL